MTYTPMSTQSGRLPIGVSITALSASLDTLLPSNVVYASCMSGASCASNASYASSLRDDGDWGCDDEDGGGGGGELDEFVQK